MTLDVGIVLDFASALALIAILAWYHGALLQRPVLAPFVPLVMGGALGLVAVVQMHAAIEPVGGLLLDLRGVPVALAGAFLGGRGLAACLVVAISARLDIGGIGLWPDVVGIALAGGAAALWARATRAAMPRGLGQLAVLGLATSVVLLPGLSLPPPLGGWLLHAVVPVMLPLHVAAVTALAALMERERHLSIIEARRTRGAG